MAENLLDKSENEALWVNLAKAKSELSLAQSSDENQRMLHAKNSLENSGVVIRALGKEPTTGAPLNLDLIFYALGTVVVVATAAGVAYGVLHKTHPRRRRGHRFH